MGSFSASAQINEVMRQVKEKLQARSSSVMQMFHSMDKDQSQQLSRDEFAACLKEFGIVLPGHTLNAFIAQFDANGDGYVSIPEFSAYMTGNTNTFDALRSAKAIEEAEPPPSRGMMPAMTRSMQQLAFEGDAHEGQRSWGAGAKPLTWRDRLFMDRMSNDLEDRRRTQFINELKKDPRFKPSMLEPPKPKFKEVSLTNGPIIKSHDRKRTGLETKKPYQWGPLGGWY